MNVSPTDKGPSVDINLFAGGGGLAVGLCAAGFRPLLMYENDRDACKTLRHNIASQHPTLEGLVAEGDLTTVEWLDQAGPVRLLAGGVPCQPFSRAGNHRGEADPRNLFPQFIAAVRRMRPMGVLVENVGGLSRDVHSEYFEYVRMQLECPFLPPKGGEGWGSHHSRLTQYRESSGYVPAYDVCWKALDAADYGVAQRRERVFIVAIRTGLGRYIFPSKTHSKAALLADQGSGAYWQRHGVAARFGLPSPGRQEGDLDVEAWVTVRDELNGLEAPAPSEEEAQNNHWVIPGARAYKGHTGTDVDMPSKTIKAGTHGVSGGENTVRGEKGAVRYYTLREMARVQGFPNEHFFVGARSSVIRQIGNAVPPGLATSIAAPLAQLLGEKC